MLVKDVYECINKEAPYNLACNWDNSGFLAGKGDMEVTNVMVALDFTEDVLSEAIKNSCNLIVTHHPFIFKGLTSITDQSYEGRLLIKLIENKMSIICAHTNLDMAIGGINDVLCEKIGLSDVSHLGFAGEDSEGNTIGELRMGNVETSLGVFIDNVKNALGCDAVKYCGDVAEKIKTVAVCSGSGSDFMELAYKSGADAFLTADAKYHDFQKALKLGISLIDAGHFETEDIICEKLICLLEKVGLKAVKSSSHNGFYKFR